MPLPLTNLTLAELTTELEALGAPAYRARQLFRGIHGRHARAWDELTDLPLALRGALADRYSLRALAQAAVQRSSDGTTKLLLAARDGQLIETVQIPAARGADGRRLTVCVSSQAGCALACRFCATGEMGFARDLTVGEIVEQVYWADNLAARPSSLHEGGDAPSPQPSPAERGGGSQHDRSSIATARGGSRGDEDSDPLRTSHGSRVDNVVFMGMGEPMANYDAVIGAIRLLAEPTGYGFSVRRVTVSTSGLVPGIERLAAEGLAVRLAISLHAPDDALRSELMPINRRYPIGEVVAAADRYAEASGRRVSYEYVMLADVNDSDACAERLGNLLRGRSAHVNLIPYNPTASQFAGSAPARIRAFASLVRDGGVACTIRASRGRDIAAACGQLKAENRRMAGVRHQ